MNKNLVDISDKIYQLHTPIFTKEKLQQLSKQLEQFYEKRRCFHRHHSQFMDVNLILSKVTPLRNARQALAHIETSFQAIKQNEYKIKKQQIEMQMKQEEIKKCNDKLKRKYLQVEIEEIEYGLQSSMGYFEGALKTIKVYIDAYESILKIKNLENFNEVDFEEQEEEYHIKTAILQSMRSVRINGKIDLGNQEYLEQCGLNPSIIEKMIQGFLIKQETNIKENQIDISMKSTYEFLDECFNTLKGCSKRATDYFGIMNKINTNAAFLGNN